METLMTQVGNFGFPVVLSIYLLVRIEGKLDKLTESIQQLSQILGAVKGLKAQGH
ncbi:MAG: YvrJ family protein [Firmicutes bacterium]|nr:YvrJ family protein [Bacillota bacterium]